MFGNKKHTKEIIVNVESLQTRIAILDEGQLDDFYIEHPSDEQIVGSIFKGKIQNLEDGLQAAFVDIGLRKNAFIHYWDMIPEDTARLEVEEGVNRRKTAWRKKWSPGEMAQMYSIGSEIVVQVTKGAIGTKGPRVTANLSIPGRYLVLLPGTSLKGVSRKIEDVKERQRLKKILTRLPVPENNGLIVRTVAGGARKTSFARDMRSLITILEDIEVGKRDNPAPCRLYNEPDVIERVVRDSLTEEVGRIIIDSRDEYERIRDLVARVSRRVKGKVQFYDGATPIFGHFDVERQLDNVFNRKIRLKSGGYLVFDETEALVAIDINTGRHKGSNSQDESIVQVNLEAAEEIARQLRLRNIGGLVIIDFIDMKVKKDQTQVFRMLRDNLRQDKARTNILPISQLGLMEMTRQRAEESIRDTTFTDCPYCSGKGKIKSSLSVSVELQRHIMEVLRKRTNMEEELPLKITVNPLLMDRLRKEDEKSLMALEQNHKGALTFVSNSNLHMEDFLISHGESGDELYSSVDR